MLRRTFATSFTILLAIAVPRAGYAQQYNRVFLYDNQCSVVSFAANIPGFSGLDLSAGRYGYQQFRGGSGSRVILYSTNRSGEPAEITSSESILTRAFTSGSDCAVQSEGMRASDLARWAGEERLAAEARARRESREGLTSHLLGVLTLGAGVALFSVDETVGPVIGIGGIVGSIAFFTKGSWHGRQASWQRREAAKYTMWEAGARAVAGRP